MLIGTKLDIEMDENEKKAAMHKAREWARQVGIGFSAVCGAFNLIFLVFTSSSLLFVIFISR
jgi:hypothetical protein